MRRCRWTIALGVVAFSLGCDEDDGSGGEGSPVPQAGISMWEGLGASSWGTNYLTRVSQGFGNGGGISATEHANDPAFALDPRGFPVVAWSDTSSGTSEIYLKAWDGTGWIELGGSASGAGISGGVGSSRLPAVSVDSWGGVVVAWLAHCEQDPVVFVKYWNGHTWSGYAESASEIGLGSAIVPNPPSLAIDSSGRPVVAWTEGATECIYIRHWNGTEWVDYGQSAESGISEPTMSADRPALVLDSADRPVVAWSANLGTVNREIFVKRWDGTTWVAYGPSASSGGISGTSFGSNRPALALDPSGNPIVAWEEAQSDTNDDIYVKRWDGSSWVELAQSASGGGISANPGHSGGPSLAVDSAGNPIVAWTDGTWFATIDDEFLGEIYVRRWNGTAWVEFLEDSNWVGGISNSDGYSGAAQIRIGGGQTFVAWMDDTSSPGQWDIYLRKTVGP